MPLLRLLLAWLIMAAIPAQGFAAASMAFCNGNHHHAVAAAHGGGEADASTLQHDHSKHSHEADAAQVKQTPDKIDSAKSFPDGNHKCSVCASCCHSLAIAEFPRWPALAQLPQAGSAELVVLIYAAPSHLPDKPPRA